MRKVAIRRISKKKQAELKEEKLLTAQLILKQDGKCADCGKILGWRSAKHEIIPRSKGGNPTDPNNTVVLCGKCHSLRHRIVEK